MAEYLPEACREGNQIPTEGVNLKINILRPASKCVLANMLDPKGDLNREGTQMTDYSGLAELIGYTNEEIEEFESKPSPTRAILENWQGSNLSTLASNTIGNLWAFLDQIDRQDVQRHCIRAFSADIETELSRQYIRETFGATDHHVDPSLQLTKSDAKNGSKNMYDAFVCINIRNEENSVDSAFARQLEIRLEERGGLKLCIPHRDDLPAAAMYDQYADLIKERCRVMIIVLSTAFLESPACEFMVKFAQALAPATKMKRLIPVIIEKMDVPNIVSHVTRCDFTKMDMEDWNWQRLLTTIQRSSNQSTAWHANQPELKCSPPPPEEPIIKKEKKKSGLLKLVRKFIKGPKNKNAPS